jgi:6-phosphofructokinase 1
MTSSEEQLSDTVKAIAVLTSGGDSPGMNAALRAVVGRATNLQVPVYAIHEGYTGMVSGGEFYQLIQWSDVRDIIERVSV